jgi:hypothetical protein
MRTEKQIAASLANGRKSSGATTPGGKASIVAANLKSGVHAKSEVLPWEEAAQLEQLKAEYYQTHQPSSPEARLLVDELITCEWTLRRLRLDDSKIWEYSAKEAYKPDEEYAPAQSFLRCDKAFARLQHRINSTRLAFHRALKDLQKLKAVQPIAAPPVVTPSVETPLPNLGSLRKPPSPAPGPQSAAPLESRQSTTHPIEATPQP